MNTLEIRQKTPQIAEVIPSWNDDGAIKGREPHSQPLNIISYTKESIKGTSDESSPYFAGTQVTTKSWELQRII